LDAKELVRRYYDEVWLKGNVEAIDDFLTDDYVDHTPQDDAPPIERLKRVAGVYRDTATDVELDLNVLIADGEHAAAFWTMAWTQRGDFFGVPADGQRLEFSGGQFFRLRDGRIAETWHADDYVGLFGQLGLTLKP
jgi:steroid delta-isomerase-like uncharacterized protein